ncbi:MAG: TlpA family protein disulfide reductase [Clostridia bacterium]|nr:TlpA family protein disulfide reductase [Clostridia bacterium]
MNKPTVFKIVAGTLATVVMGTALVYYNFIDKAAESGIKQGNRCLDFTAQTYAVNDRGEFYVDGNTFTLSEQIGKVVVVNFWETWCAACVHELPYFDRIQKEYEGKVEVLALAGVTSTIDAAAAWMNREGWKSYAPESDWRDFSLTVGWLETETCTAMGCSGSLPRTVIVDKSGIVVYEGDGAMTYESLQTQIESVL